MSIGVLTKYFTRFNTTTMILYTYVYGVRPIIQQSDSQIVRRSVCCLHIYSYLELTGQVSIFSCFQFHFQFHFHFDCTFTSFFNDFLFPVSLCTTMPLHQCEIQSSCNLFISLLQTNM
jgi:hypothetical protein